MIVLAKLNALEILQYEKAIMSRADSIKILYQELKTGILSLTDIQEQVDMNKKQVLDLHNKKSKNRIIRINTGILSNMKQKIKEFYH